MKPLSLLLYGEKKENIFHLNPVCLDLVRALRGCHRKTRNLNGNIFSHIQHWKHFEVLKIKACRSTGL